jgi:hypothetical protein
MENSFHFADNEMEEEDQLHGRYRVAWNRGGCLNVFSVAFWDRKIIMGTLQRIGSQAGCKSSSIVARDNQHYPYRCTSPSPSP